MNKFIKLFNQILRPSISHHSAGLGTQNFYFQDRIFEISGHFSGHKSHKNAFFVISGAYNLGTFRAEAKITIRRHEVVYRLSSERKTIDLE